MYAYGSNEMIRKPCILAGGTGRSHAALHIARELHSSSWREQKYSVWRRLTCTRLRDHSSLRPAASCLSSARAVASGVRFCLRISLARSPPEQYSMTRNILPFSCGHRVRTHDTSEVAHSFLQALAGSLPAVIIFLALNSRICPGTASFRALLGAVQAHT